MGCATADEVLMTGFVGAIRKGVEWSPRDELVLVQ